MIIYDLEIEYIKIPKKVSDLCKYSRFFAKIENFRYDNTKKIYLFWG